MDQVVGSVVGRRWLKRDVAGEVRAVRGRRLRRGPTLVETRSSWGCSSTPRVVGSVVGRRWLKRRPGISAGLRPAVVGSVVGRRWLKLEARRGRRAGGRRRLRRGPTLVETTCRPARRGSTPVVGSVVGRRWLKPTG